MKTFLGLRFKLAEPKKRNSKPVRVSNHIYNGVCFKEGEVWKIHVPYPDDTQMIALEFTEKSYSLKRPVVFKHGRDKEGRYHMVVRQEREYKYSPGLDTQYTPFCEDFVYKGYIVRIYDKLYFDMIDIIGKKIYDISD